MAVATALADWIASEPRRFTYRFVFAPGTIGSLTWLKRNESRLRRVRHGLVLGLLGDPGALTYKRSRHEATRDRRRSRPTCSQGEGSVIAFLAVWLRRAPAVLARVRPAGRAADALGQRRLSRVPHLGRRSVAHHAPGPRAAAWPPASDIVDVLEATERYINLSPKGEPRLGKRGLYGALGGGEPDGARARPAVGAEPVRRAALAAGHRPPLRNAVRERCRVPRRPCARRASCAWRAPRRERARQRPGELPVQPVPAK